MREGNISKGLPAMMTNIHRSFQENIVITSHFSEIEKLNAMNIRENNDARIKNQSA